MFLQKQRIWVVVAIIAVLAFCAWAMIMYIGYTREPDLGDAFSLGQLILEALLIPAAIISLWYATREFQKGQRRPALYLAWDDNVLTDLKKTEMYLKRPDPLGTETPPRVNRSIALHNSGNNVAIWYSINLSFPVELFRGRRTPPGWDQNLMGLSGFYGEVGGKDLWSQRQLPGTQDEIFQSNGILAAYPDQKIQFGTL